MTHPYTSVPSAIDDLYARVTVPAYTNAEIDAKFATVTSMNVNTYIPHRPTVDGNGKIDVFAMYNFAHPTKTNGFYISDIDAVNTLLLVANDGNSANTNLFVAKDMSSDWSQSIFKWSNTPITHANIPGRIISVRGVSSTQMHVVNDAGTPFLVTTNGQYDTPSAWTVTNISAISTPGDDIVLQSENGVFVRLDLANNIFRTYNSSMTALQSMTSYDTNWTDKSLIVGFPAITSDSPAYYRGNLIYLGNNEWQVILCRIIYTASEYAISEFMFRFTVNASGVVTWIVNPATAGWKSKVDNATSIQNGGAGLYNGYTFDLFNGRGYNRITMGLFANWSGCSLTQCDSIWNTTTNSKNIIIPDSSPISKSSFPGHYFEIMNGSTVYSLRSGTSSSGANFVLYRGQNGATKSSPIVGGLANGTTYYTVTEFNGGTGFSSFATAKYASKPYLYWMDSSRNVYQIGTNGSVLTKTLIGTLPAPGGQRITGFLVDPRSNTLYVTGATTYTTPNTLWKVVSGVYVKMWDYGLEYKQQAGGTRDSDNPATNFFDADVNNGGACWLFAGAGTTGGAVGAYSINFLNTGVKISGASIWPYGCSAGYSLLTNRIVLAASPSADYTSCNEYTYTDANMSNFGMASYTLPLTANIGLVGYLNNANVLLGGYVSDVFGGLEKTGMPTTVTLKPNATNYVYLTRFGQRGIKARVSTINETPNFFKIRIATIVTDSVGATSTTIDTNNTF